MKTLVEKILLILVLALITQGCSSTKKTLKVSPKTQLNLDKLSNFDKIYIPNNAPIIAEMISIVQPELEVNKRHEIANGISEAVTKYKVEPQIMVALIDTESNFKFDKISTTGDLSIAQVNVDVWNIEFKRLKLPLVDVPRLTSEDQSYALEVMAQILSILKKRHIKKDRRWYARYHSNTKKYKHDYLRKIEVRMKLLSSSKTLTDMTKVAINEFVKKPSAKY
jgi:PBP1b-binding outer membrane lipoprotein LpoB